MLAHQLLPTVCDIFIHHLMFQVAYTVHEGSSSLTRFPLSKWSLSRPGVAHTTSTPRRNALSWIKEGMYMYVHTSNIKLVSLPLSFHLSHSLSLYIHIYIYIYIISLPPGSPPSLSLSFLPSLPEVDMAHHHRGTHSAAAQKVTECSYVSGKFQHIK